jgi:hypothetical protein
MKDQFEKFVNARVRLEKVSQGPNPSSVQQGAAIEGTFTFINLDHEFCAAVINSGNYLKTSPVASILSFDDKSIKFQTQTSEYQLSLIESNG